MATAAQSGWERGRVPWGQTEHNFTLSKGKKVETKSSER